MSIQQAGRFLTIDTPLGENQVFIKSFNGIEKLSCPFTYQIIFQSANATIKPQDLLGKPITVTVGGKGTAGSATTSERNFHGLVNELEALDFIGDGGVREYAIDLVPWFSFLDYTNNCRIFQEKTSLDIIQEIFKEKGYSDFEISGVKETYPKRPYCVQYNESDFDFVSRLMEEEGIFYYFKHEKTKHILVLADHNDGGRKCEEDKVIWIKQSQEKGGHIHQWLHKNKYHTGKISHVDYFSEKPKQNLKSEHKTATKLTDIAKFESYSYQERYTEKARGDHFSKTRMQAVESEFDVIEGESNCKSFFAGGLFELTGYHNAEELKPYLITQIHHHISEGSVDSSGITQYTNQFDCIAKDTPFKPAVVTKKPAIVGPQTALVVGPKGEEIHTDKMARIKVQFYWDKLGKKDEKTTCWIRVGQPWAGKGWGAYFIPRIGHEVIVQFLSGDPDQPLITGSVYNGVNDQPYSAKTQTGIKSRSTKQGSPANFNEFRFDDKKGSEEVYLQAEKDFNWFVKNNETGKIEANQTITVKKNRTITVTDGNETVSVEKGTMLLEAKEHILLKVGGSTIKIEPSMITVKSSLIKLN